MPNNWLFQQQKAAVVFAVGGRGGTVYEVTNLIIRYLRCRLGDAFPVEDDAMNCWSGNFQNIIIDHCSLSWSIDETELFMTLKILLYNGVFYLKAFIGQSIIKATTGMLVFGAAKMRVFTTI